MKKYLLLGTVIVLSVHFITYTATADLSKQEKALERQTEALRGERSLMREQFVKGTAYGAAAGAALGAGGVAAGAIDPDETISGPTAEYLTDSEYAKKAGGIFGMGVQGAYGGAVTGAILGIPIAQGLQWWQRRKINAAVNEHLDISLKEMTKPQAMLVVAAYKRNVPLMKLLINRQQEFVHQKGVWPLLTELFFNKKPMSVRIKRLQKIIQES